MSHVLVDLSRLKLALFRLFASRRRTSTIGRLERSRWLRRVGCGHRGGRARRARGTGVATRARAIGAVVLGSSLSALGGGVWGVARLQVSLGSSRVLLGSITIEHTQASVMVRDGARATEPCEAIVVLIARGTQGAWWQSTRRHYVGCISRCHHTDERVLLAVARRSTKPTERAASESSSRSIAQSIDGWMDVDRQRQQQDAQQELLNNQGPDVVVVVASPPND